MPDATCGAPVGASVSTVVSNTFPSEVIQPIVFFVIVVMTALEALWARSNKRLQDEAMNPMALANSVAITKANNPIACVIW